ncbi:tRNA (guanine-N(7)-)-methyltransferase non-catalytic subunit WDR4 isoform X3 [Alligator sinensis]|uniref:tRNA (Guanine-N(7)-)-methyltransferase non-catalytic subunit WDR4 isoform X3 n=1 Tax=Alligator sinensis TaxID=38654 RepID=A0A3Q0FKZ9_ALLSI|nr:tRNA (guanine-N(7)-)-methyltransferase non-catalytic subunit WDR4 isoform X3 [Alligator sinensis]
MVMSKSRDAGGASSCFPGARGWAFAWRKRRQQRRCNDGDLFVYDCVTANKRTQEKGQAGQPTDKASNDILAFAFSSSGNYFALTDDNKHLILFRTKPSWECISIRSVVRRSTSLIITAAEDKILIADKSGDVYSYSITDPQAAGKLELGHLSLLMDVALSPDDQYILTADRDEKIRVSLTRAPHNIVAFCLGHKEFVSRIFVIPDYPDLLLSASGKYAVSRISYCCQGSYIAILCDCIPTVYIFQLVADTQQLIHKKQIPLNHKGWDVALEETGELWIFQENKVTPLLLYRPMDGQWQPVNDDKGLLKMSKYLHDNWTVFEGSVGTDSCYHTLYKASFDNMTTYLQKKEQRLQQQQKRKRKELQHGTNGQNKKIKTGEPPL